MVWRSVSALVGLLLVASPCSAQGQGPTTPAKPGGTGDLTLSGSFRARYETLDGQYRPGLDGSDQLVSLRTLVAAEWDLGPVRLIGELQDSRAYGSDEGGGVSTGEVNALELVQAHLAASAEDVFGAGSTTAVRVGRFKLDVGSRRLVGANNFRNTTNAFTGADLDWRRNDDRLLAFYTLPQTRLPDDQAALLDNAVQWDRESSDLRLWGALYERSRIAGDARLELFAIGLEERDGGDRRTRDRDLLTVGGRLFRDPAEGRWDFEMEAGVQSGTSRASTAPADTRDLDVSAHYAHLEIGRSFSGRWSPRVALEYDLASGDRDPGDDQNDRFDGLFGPRRPDFGPTGIYGPLGRSNIDSPGVRLEVRPSSRWDGFVFYRALWLDQPRDAFANTGVRDASGASGRFAGHQLEWRARYWITPRVLRLEFGGAALFTGQFLEDAPNATDQGDVRYGWLEINRSF